MSEMKIRELTGFVKDTSSSAVLNDDMAALNAYRAAKKRNSQIDDMLKRINNLESIVKELSEKLKERNG